MRLTGIDLGRAPAKQTTATNQNPFGNQNPMDGAQATPNVSNPIQKITNAPMPGLATGRAPAQGATIPSNTPGGAPQTGLPAPTNDFMSRWSKSPLKGVAESGMESARTTGILAQDKAKKQAQLQAAAMGLDPNSVAYRKLMEQARDQGISQNVGIAREAGLDAQDMMQQFRTEDENKALAAFEMMDPNQRGTDVLASTLATGGDIGSTVAGMTGQEGLQDQYETTQAEADLEMAVKDLKLLRPELTDQEAQDIALQEMNVASGVEKRGLENEAEEQRVADVINGLVEGESVDDFGTKQWGIVNASDGNRDSVTTKKIGSWVDNKNFFDDKTRDEVPRGMVQAKLDENGVTPGSYIQHEGRVVMVQDTSVTKTGKGRRGEWVVKVVIQDPPGSENTRIVESRFDRG